MSSSVRLSSGAAPPPPLSSNITWKSRCSLLPLIKATQSWTYCGCWRAPRTTKRGPWRSQRHRAPPRPGLRLKIPISLKLHKVFRVLGLSWRVDHNIWLATIWQLWGYARTRLRPSLNRNTDYSIPELVWACAVELSSATDTDTLDIAWGACLTHSLGLKGGKSQGQGCTLHVNTLNFRSI